MKVNDIYSDIWGEKEISDANKLLGPILVVGASGFIGSKLLFSLRKVRDDVFACSRNPRRSWRLVDVPSQNLISIDVTKYDDLKRTIDTIKPQTVFNLSAYGSYSRQIDQNRIHMTNYIGTLNLIKALSESGINAFVQAGSSSEYGLNCSDPKESDELIPNSDYAVSKVSAGYLIKYYGKILSFPCVNLRLYSVYGPWEERDRLIPTLIYNCLQGKLPNFVEKNISRDFVYVDDCTAALVRSALTVCRTDPGTSINIATGVKTSMEEIANIAKKLFQITGSPSFGSMPNRKWDLSNWYGNAALAKKIMGWETKTSFEEGLKITAEWEKAAEEKIKHVNIPQQAKKVSVIIACYKDDKSIPILHERLTQVFRGTGNDYEIIFVNDASPYDDENVINVLSLKDNHVIGVTHSRNFGSQSSFISGMEIATGDAVVLMDGDGQDPPEIINDFIKKWNQGYDIVYGERIKRKAPFYMQILTKLFYRIFRQLSEIKMPVDAGDFSLIDKRAVSYLLKFSEKDVFLRGLRAWIGFRQTGVPYVRPERLFGRSTNNFFKNIWWAKKGIFSFSTKPLQYIQAAGTFFFLLTVALSLFYFINYFINPPRDSRGVTTIVLLVLGIGSIQLLSVSIIGDYIGKIIEEVKNRPKFIRSKVLFNGKIYDDELKIAEVINELKSQQED